VIEPTRRHRVVLHDPAPEPSGLALFWGRP